MSNDIIIFDSEIIPSHYLFCARRVSDKKVVVLWGHKPDDMVRLRALLANPTLTWVGFNSNSFDMPLATAAAGGASVRELKEMADRIINSRRPAWMSYRDEGLEEIGADSIDLMEVAPGVMVSLKLYGARMGSPNLLDMPIHHEDSITDEQAETVLLPYCINDLDETERLYNEIIGSIKLREQLSEKYGIDLRSKSDAQMAETIIAKQLGLLRAPKPAIPQTVTYRAPSFIQPKGAILKDILHRVQRHTFSVTQSNGAVELPEFLKKEHVLIGDGVFQMGVGGLHSKHDKCISYVATPDFEIEDADVGAFYPNLLLNAGYVPRGLGKPFIDIYRGLVETRIAAKQRAKVLKKLPTLTDEEKRELEECKVLDSGGKIQINGTFGKLGSCFSKIYSPDLMLGITLSGQFYLLTLIEHLYEIGVKVLSANTDGVTYGGTPAKMAEARKFIEVYGWASNFEFEFVNYKSISFKDVNNYIAVKTSGEVKAKGLYASSGLMKNPANEICSMAAAAYLAKGTSVSDFIRKHLTRESLTDFLQSRTVNGGAIYYTSFETRDDWVEISEGVWRKGSDDRNKLSDTDWWLGGLNSKSRPAPYTVGVDPVKLGRVARWYYSTDPACSNGLRYATNGNLVPKSTGGKALLKLPDAVPADIDVNRYIDEAIDNLANMGVTYKEF